MNPINDYVLLVQIFIKPQLVSLNSITTCSESPISVTLNDGFNSFNGNGFNRYSWTSTASSSTIKIQANSNGTNIIQDLITNTGNANETVLYTVTPKLIALNLNPDVTFGPASTTTSGDPMSFTVTVIAPPKITSVENNNSIIYSNQSVVFIPHSNITPSTYTWYDSMDKTTIIGSGTLSKTNLSVGTYTFYITATDPNSCEGSAFVAQVQVLAIPVQVEKEFTPNNDGIDDTWIITNIDEFPNCSIQVFNIYGNNVYTSTGYNVPWNGTFRNKSLPVGTYFYIIYLYNGSPPLSGYVAILR